MPTQKTNELDLLELSKCMAIDAVIEPSDEILAKFSAPELFDALIRENCLIVTELDNEDIEYEVESPYTRDADGVGLNEDEIVELMQKIQKNTLNGFRCIEENSIKTVVNKPKLTP